MQRKEYNYEMNTVSKPNNTLAFVCMNNLDKFKKITTAPPIFWSPPLISGGLNIWNELKDPSRFDGLNIWDEIKNISATHILVAPLEIRWFEYLE